MSDHSKIKNIYRRNY